MKRFFLFGLFIGIILLVGCQKEGQTESEIITNNEIIEQEMQVDKIYKDKDLQNPELWIAR